MVRCRFVFDIVIANIMPLSAEYEEATDFNVEIQFNDFATKITPSRINVREFRAGYSYEYVEEAEQLRETMTPISITVNYGEETIGSATYLFPEEVFRKLESMNEVVEQDICEFINDADEKAGDIEILYRIVPKCKDLDDDDGGEVDIEEMQEFLKKSLKENDLLFVLGEKKYLEPCIEDLVLENTEKDPVALDLTKYREMSGRLVPTPSVLNTCCNPDCCGLKKFTKRQAGASMETKLTCGGVNLMSRKQKGAKPKCLICDPNRSTSESDEDSEAESDPCKGKGQSFIGDVQWGSTPPPKVCLNTPPPELTQVVNITPRCCPVCRTNIDWLPALSPCPKCNYKPVPIMSEAQYNMNLTADQIIRDFMNRERPSDPIDCRAAVYQPKDDDGEQEAVEQAGKQCASSQLRKSCQNVFPRRDGGSSHSAEMPQNDEICEGPENLIKIFKNMKQIFNDAEKLEKRTEARKERCGKLLENREEAELTRKMFEPIKNYAEPLAACSNIEQMRERMSRCESIFPECNRKVGLPPAICKKLKKKQLKAKCLYPCPFRKTVKKKSDGCVRPKLVPANVGWLWKKEEKAKLGWKPGAVCRPIRNIMAFFLKGFPPDTFKIGNPCPPAKQESPESNKPMLYICKRNGEYYVTLRPVFDPYNYKTCYNPCKKIKPIQFTITKTPEQIELRNLRDQLLCSGYAPCKCNKPVASCCCRCKGEKLKLLLEVMKECCNRGIGNCGEKLVLNDEGDSDAEFEFGVTPPFGTIKPPVCRRKTATHGTQYDAADLEVKPLYPKPVDPYAKPYQCDIGQKYITKWRRRKA